MKAKKAFIAKQQDCLITGIAGQDGSYLAELLLDLGYQVIGVVRDKTNMDNLKHIQSKIRLYEVDLANFSKLKSIILEIKPNQIYNLGGVSTLAAFAKQPLYSRKVTEEAALVILEAALDLKRKGLDVRVFQASSCLIFGSPGSCPQNEHTPANPTTHYAKTKLRVDLYAKNLRDNDGLNVSCGILYNHESPRRPLDFVTRKITAAAVCIYNKVKKIPCDKSGRPILTENLMLKIGNINARRDWGDARDFVRAFLLMLEQVDADDYIIATGQTHSVQEVMEIAFGFLGLDWRNYIVEDQDNMRPLDPVVLCGDATKARLKLGWTPQIKFKDTIVDMVKNDVRIFSK